VGGLSSDYRPVGRTLLLAALLITPLAATRAGAQPGLALALEPMVSGLARPLAVADPGDGSGRLFIAQQAGLIRIWDGSQLLPTPFLDLTSLTNCCVGTGLLGLAFDPDYTANGHVYVSYTDLSDNSVIARYSVSVADPDVADPASATILLQVDQPSTSHNNDHLAFGPDGYLYISMGDGGGAGGRASAQDPTSLLGKMLRIDPHGDDFPEPDRNYAIPPDNPFVGDPSAREEIWALGLRNPWRYSFDRESGDLWIGDVGAASLEEVDFQPATGPGGENYGWGIMEGTSCVQPPEDCNDGSLTLPVLEYGHELGCAVTGGYRYRGGLEPRLRGVYLYGDFCSGTIWGTVPRCDGMGEEARELLASGLSISSFGEDESGEVYVVHIHNVDGGVFRLVTAGGGGPDLDSSAPILDFGTPAPGAPVSLPLTLTNNNPGPAAAILERIALSDTVRFTLDLEAGASPCGPVPICLPPGVSCTAEVDFSSLGGSFDERLSGRGNFDALDLPLSAEVPCGGPEDLTVDNLTIDSTAELVGCRSVTVGPGVVLEASSDTAIRAGRYTQLVDGLTVRSGARLRIESDPSLRP
jgi:glucose/arabinose dehydrogenase